MNSPSNTSRGGGRGGCLGLMKAFSWQLAACVVFPKSVRLCFSSLFFFSRVPVSFSGGGLALPTSSFGFSVNVSQIMGQVVGFSPDVHTYFRSYRFRNFAKIYPYVRKSCILGMI